MSNNIVEEENPNQPQPSGGAQDKIRKQARQLAYDVRYKVKQGFKDGLLASYVTTMWYQLFACRPA